MDKGIFLLNRIHVKCEGSFCSDKWFDYVWTRIEKSNKNVIKSPPPLKHAD